MKLFHLFLFYSRLAGAFALFHSCFKSGRVLLVSNNALCFLLNTVSANSSSFGRKMSGKAFYLTVRGGTCTDKVSR